MIPQGLQCLMWHQEVVQRQTVRKIEKQTNKQIDKQKNIQTKKTDRSIKKVKYWPGLSQDGDRD